MDKDKLIKLNLTWFKESGKYYSEGNCWVRPGTYLWSEDFKQQVMDTQDGLRYNWPLNLGWSLLVDISEEENKKWGDKQFFLHLFPSSQFFSLIKPEKSGTIAT